jgi:hypothetical protein
MHFVDRQAVLYATRSGRNDVPYARLACASRHDIRRHTSLI